MFTDTLPAVPESSLLDQMLSDGGSISLADGEGYIGEVGTINAQPEDFAAGARRIVFTDYIEFPAVEIAPTRMSTHVVLQLADGTPVVAVPGFQARVGWVNSPVAIPACAIFFDR